MAKWNTGVPYCSFSRFGAQNIDTFGLLKIFEWWYVTGITSNRNLGCLGWYSKIPQTGWLAKDRNLVFTILDLGSLRSGASEGEFWWQCFSGLQRANFLLRPHMVWGDTLSLPLLQEEPWFLRQSAHGIPAMVLVSLRVEVPDWESLFFLSCRM